jgi:CHAT domain-containing protein
MIREGSFYTDSLATATAFRQSLERSAIVHVASHASGGASETLVGAGDASGASGDVEAPHVELFDRPFYPVQLADLASAPTLVVLSACQTGNGRLVAGEGAQSIARAFTAAGTNTVMSSWWNVNDAVTAGLIKAFYRGLSDGRPAATALRSAQLDWICDPGVQYLQKLPYYWAALHCQGNPAPAMRRFSSGHLWYWLVAGVIVLFLVIMMARKIRLS